MSTFISWITSLISFLQGKLQKELAQSKARIAELEKYQKIIDAEFEADKVRNNAIERAKEIITSAERQASDRLEQASTELAKTLLETQSMRKEAEESAKEIKKEAKATLESATEKAKQITNEASIRVSNIISGAQINANKIIVEAEKQAETIAGEAYQAMKEASALKKTVQTLKNIIEGYGNQYLIPSYSILDELADEFAFTEPAERLKQTKDIIKQMVKNRTAAQSMYVEDNRKITAIDFIMDAFNGKVDTIMSSVKHDNLGTLEQKIYDAYQVVNMNGQAFRNTAITPEYLSLRLQELKYAVALNELKDKEREEQRVIKERMREEEKARKEYEKALKDAQKEEETIRKAIEKAQQEVNKATEAQKAEYEAKLAQLLGKLKDAESKNQRAMSMAQKTKAGHVYIISNIGSFGLDVNKVGMTRRLNPLDRVKELGDASVPFEFDVHAMIYSEDAPNLENQLHQAFAMYQVNKVNPRKEFFRIPISAIKEELEKMGIVDVKWTMLAEAKEYRESLAIEETIKNNEEKKQEWLKRQLDIAQSDTEEDLEIS